MTALATNHTRPLVLLAVSEPSGWWYMATILRQEGMRVVLALGERACLRVATAVHPDIILLDPRLPRALLSLLRAHPQARTAQISWSPALDRRSRRPAAIPGNPA